MKLTKEEIQYIDQYVQKSGIKWFDLKVELVDHLTHKTENVLNQNPNLDFKEALYQAKLSFGSKGFKPIILEKTKQIERRFFKDVFRYFKSFFTVPKIIITVAITLFLIGMYTRLKDKDLFFISLIGVLFICAIVFFFNAYKRKKLNNNLSLTLSHMLQFSSLINTMVILLNLGYSILRNDLIKDNNYIFFICIWLVMFLIALSIENVSKKIYANQKRLYFKYL